jgi:hypothetical protein
MNHRIPPISAFQARFEAKVRGRPALLGLAEQYCNDDRINSSAQPPETGCLPRWCGDESRTELQLRRVTVTFIFVMVCQLSRLPSEKGHSMSNLRGPHKHPMPIAAQGTLPSSIAILNCSIDLSPKSRRHDPSSSRSFPARSDG